MTRLIAGMAGGRRLKVPPAGVRPTGDRAREGLFNSLGTLVDLEGAAVLDLYAGSGALGIEALSRGAASAVFVESDRRAVAVIEGNLETIGAEGAEVVKRDVAAWLRGPPEAHFDLVFCDPPYDAAPSLAQLLSDLLPRVTAPQALIVTESSKRNPLLLDLPLIDERVYGDTRIAIYRGG